MFFIEQISNKIGSKISSNLNLDKDTQEIITYGAFAVLQILWSFLCVVILGYICNVLLESIIISLVIAVFRKYSGGIHANSPNKCAIFGAIICAGFALIVKNININLNLIFILIFILVFIYSYYAIFKFVPVDTKSKPIDNIDEKLRLKKCSFLVISILFLIEILFVLLYLKYKYIALIYYGSCVLMGVLWQSFTLTPISKKMFANVVME
ncbi:accessory gene regulator B family protein [Clostridium botulinum]|uniref:Accessory regulator AgrB n=2 Tax=Clostridium botulinum TaxID=1491 RepID=A0A846I2X4_CLOBO|nr:accessory gene regulator B family protein [Clostridium botulinum]AJD28730.1 accessory regulator [Clostridium botulinum CDC_297]EPS52299.1 putative accessory gene regulator protein B [Clostridium botulinum A1 str. CFSAN002368]ACQ52469.1 putative accessory gene regulator protein B [Clostridium botulinum Ba4 str. 657]AJE09677.1 accessory regulator [Clostridium botulinum CDC_1436]APR01418.1 accessory regulator [Clostridium botulinum]